MKIHTFRLKEGVELKDCLLEFARKNVIEAAIILSVVAGAKEVELRMAGAKPEKQNIKNFKGDFEVISSEGTLSKSGIHVHASLSDKSAKVFGGHLKKLIVRITAEVTILELTDRKFLRELDKETGFKELLIK